MKDKETKRLEAEVRNEDWASLSPKKQLASLDRRLGKGVGAKKDQKYGKTFLAAIKDYCFRNSLDLDVGRD